MYPLKISEKYDPEKLSSLWHRFTTYYLGNYVPWDFDENVWSHPWVDVVPETENDFCYAVLDGEIEYSWEKWAYGNVVVIKHENAPDPDDHTKTTTLYSNFLHLSERSVETWEKVKEWDAIWKTWNTWMSFWEHLHFQIDKDTAPFHPFWPYTGSEAQEAGVSFIEWVNIWLWMEDAKKHTVNPCVYLDAIEWVSRTTVETVSTTTPVESVVVSSIPEIVTAETVVTSSIPEIISTETVIATSTPEIISEESITVASTTPEVISTKEDIILAEDVIIPLEKVVVRTPQTEKVISSDADVIVSEEVISSDSSVVSDDVIITEDAFIPEVDTTPVVEKIVTETPIVSDSTDYVIADLEDTTSVTQVCFKDIDVSHPYFDFLNSLYETWVIKWYEDGTFRWENEIVRSEMLKMIFLFSWKIIINDPVDHFVDVPSDAWFKKYINSALEYGIISLPDNKKFRPHDTMTVVEWLKMAIKTLVGSVENVYTQTFTDVKVEDWFAKYVEYAIKNSLMVVDGDKFNPNQNMTRIQLVWVLQGLKNMSIV